ncbi:hypothetical protein [Swingsia samuiensis]|uniref:Lipoprotein n=1 Tax=Swingsia samuiensis TaxID=1293412 RepID=A0A4Y6UIT7_9PROT|nr:hypothetical protein [Swingsia samuiensis]QDH16291.1 hypothetical protein E3D00_00920 [Swingsia samuiensis]
MPALRRLALSFYLPTCALLALSTLAGCGESDPQLFAPACPATDVPAATADQFVYNNQSLDVGSLISHAQLTAIAGDCERGPQSSDDQQTTRTRISLAMNLTRGPAAKDNIITVPYFVAIMRDGKIIDKKIFKDTFALPANVSTQSVRTELRLIDLPASQNLQENPYTLEIGYQLTPDELTYNRQHLPIATFERHSQ